MLNILFLDDDAQRTQLFVAGVPHAVTVETAADCIDKLTNHEWDIVCLDHDLGGEVYVDSSREDCGMEVVRWIVENKPKVKLFIVYSYNGSVVQEMVARLVAVDYDAVYIPFSSKMVQAVATAKRG